MDDFIVDDDSDEEAAAPKKRKLPATTPSRKNSNQAPASTPPLPTGEDLDLDIPEGSTGTALQWKFDPESTEPRKERALQAAPKTPSSGKKKP